MNRFFYIALSFWACLSSPVLHALGMGEIEVYSYLNQNFHAEIPLADAGNIPLTDIKAKLASALEFEQVGLDYIDALSLLQFELRREPSGKVLIDIHSSGKITQPYLQFLLNLTWPKGQLYRAYTVLLDPPSYKQAE